MARKKKTPEHASAEDTTTTAPVATAETQGVPEVENAEGGEQAADPHGQDARATQPSEPTGETPVSPEPAPEPKPKTDAYALKPVKLHLRVNYTDLEKVEFARQMAEAQKTIEQIEAEKKRANTQFKSRLESAGADRDEMMDRIQSGYEMRETACTVTANTPSVGVKTITRSDTGEIVRVEPMTLDERQMELPGVTAQSGDDDGDPNAEDGHDCPAGNIQEDEDSAPSDEKTETDY